MLAIFSKSQNCASNLVNNRDPDRDNSREKAIKITLRQYKTQMKDRDTAPGKCVHTLSVSGLVSAIVQ